MYDTIASMNEVASFPAHVRFDTQPRLHGPLERRVRGIAARIFDVPELVQPALPANTVYTLEPLQIPNTPFCLGDSFNDGRTARGSLAIIGADAAEGGGHKLYIDRTWSDGYLYVTADMEMARTHWESRQSHMSPDELVTLLRDGHIAPQGDRQGNTERARALCKAVAVLPTIPSREGGGFRFNPNTTEAEYSTETIGGARVYFASASNVYEFGKRHKGEALGKRLQTAFEHLLGFACERTPALWGEPGLDMTNGIVYEVTATRFGRTRIKNLGLSVRSLVANVHAVERLPNVADMYGFSPGAREWLRRYVLALHKPAEAS